MALTMKRMDLCLKLRRQKFRYHIHIIPYIVYIVSLFLIDARYLRGNLKCERNSLFYTFNNTVTISKHRFTCLNSKVIRQTYVFLLLTRRFYSHPLY